MLLALYAWLEGDAPRTALFRIGCVEAELDLIWFELDIFDIKNF